MKRRCVPISEGAGGRKSRRVNGDDKKDDESWIAPSNPLMVPCTLELVLSNLPLLHMRECRQVCKLWNQEITRASRKREALKIHNDDYSVTEGLLSRAHEEMILTSLELRECCTSHDLFEKLIIFKGNLLNQLTLEKCHINVVNFHNLVLTESFPYLSCLTLRQNEYVDNQGRKTIFCSNVSEEPLLRFPYLKALEIDERGTGSQTTLVDIAVICPNLHKLIYSNCPLPDTTIEPTEKLSSLEFLQLAPMDGRTMDEQYFNALVKLKMSNLKSLFLYGMTPGGKRRMQALKRLLVNVAPTLTALHLGQRILHEPEFSMKYATPFPVELPNLQRISIGPGFLGSLKILEKSPKLRSLVCNRTTASDWGVVLKKGLPKNSSIGSLDLGDITDKSLKLLSPAFSQLVRLEINASRVDNHDGILRSICDGLPLIQMFNIYDMNNQGHLSDSGVTGISSEEESSKPLRPSDIHTPKHQLPRQFPYIGNLKCLIDLRLQYLSKNLTDISVLYGVVETPSLFALDISKSQITDASLEVMAKTLPNLSILYLRDCANLSPHGISKFRTSRPRVQLKL